MCPLLTSSSSRVTSTTTLTLSRRAELQPWLLSRFRLRPRLRGRELRARLRGLRRVLLRRDTHSLRLISLPSCCSRAGGSIGAGERIDLTSSTELTGRRSGRCQRCQELEGSRGTPTHWAWEVPDLLLLSPLSSNLLPSISLRWSRASRGGSPRRWPEPEPRS